MNDKILAIFLLAMLPGLSLGLGSQNYLCVNGDLQRRVEIFYETGVTVPCEVHYYKDTEAPGETMVLWHAQNESGYCERKTQGFIAKLENMGWNCGQHDAAGERNEPGQADESEQGAETGHDDDTEALVPGGE